MEKQIIDYLISIGFEIQPVGLPLNDFELFKRNLYLSIKSNFIRSKLLKFWPIKFKKERPNKSIWFKFVNSFEKTIIEVGITPLSESHKIHQFEKFYTNFDFSKYYLSIYFDDSSETILLDSESDYLSIIETKLLEINPLKENIREFKLSKLLN